MPQFFTHSVSKSPRKNYHVETEKKNFELDLAKFQQWIIYLSVVITQMLSCLTPYFFKTNKRSVLCSNILCVGGIEEWHCNYHYYSCKMLWNCFLRTFCVCCSTPKTFHLKANKTMWKTVCRSTKWTLIKELMAIICDMTYLR